MGVQERRRTHVPRHRSGELDGRADLRHGAGERMRQVDAHPARRELRVGEHLVEPVYRTAGHAHRLQQVEPRALRARFHHGGDERHEEVAVAHAVGVPGESGMPETSQNFANWLSLPTASITWPSAHAKTW